MAAGLQPPDPVSAPRTILIAGASGYIGRALIPELRARFPAAKIVALSRAPRTSDDPLVEWRACDLFSLKELEQALPAELDVAYYLVHSMAATANLDQGSFADYDLILADNFARAIKQRTPVHVVYLGGLIPRHAELSPHLRSRREVQQVFTDRALDHTSFRAGLILGPHGSSTEILLRLVKRLPVMLCPRWTQTMTAPIDLAAVVRALAEVAGDPSSYGHTYDLAGCQSLTYLEMMRETARWLGLRRRFVGMPFFSPTLSRFWVALITRMPKALIYPLIESLRHEMVPRPDHLYGPPPTRTYAELLRAMPETAREQSQPAGYQPEPRHVRSVQRLPRPPSMDAEAVKLEYAAWLPRFFWPFIRVWFESPAGATPPPTIAADGRPPRAGGLRMVFSFVRKRWRLLELDLSSERSSSDRQLLYITGGRLSGGGARGRLELREVLERRYVLAAIHQFKPALPWYVYRYSQALVHLSVMRAFGRHLARIARRDRAQLAAGPSSS